MEFSVPPRQRARGEINVWQPPGDVLSLRRGSVQDHAVLLCCALLGLGKMAFVCKGTVQDGKEHVWVMTREQGGTVTFWESTTGAKYHLPNRWSGDPSGSDQISAQVEQRWRDRGANWKWQDQEHIMRRTHFTRAQHLEHMDDLRSLPISSWKEFYEHEGNIVVVPYDTIEVIFNGTQLWGNLGNHHPACVYYDMEHDRRSWQPLVSETEMPRLQASKGVAIPVGPAISKSTIEALQSSIEAEIRESVRLIRMRQGFESYFEESELMQETLEQQLSFLEYECGLDADWVYEESGELRKPWGGAPPFNSKPYVEHCKQEWAKYWQQKKHVNGIRVYLPVKENHVLSGVPMHFSTSDVRELRKHLLVSKACAEYLNLPSDDVVFSVCVKIFPMPSSVASVWVFLGAEIPLPADTIAALAQSQYKDFVERSPLPE